MDDIKISKWLEAARVVTARGSPQFVKRHATRNLRYVGYLRQELGIRYRESIVVTLASKGGVEKKVRHDLSGRREKYGAWPRSKTEILCVGRASDPNKGAAATIS